ncbi:hypothetical protein MMC07_004628 [Pseudocyphellaria aurata]|nr:hypothetical protein [Pseudocyphellaria aurata]
MIEGGEISDAAERRRSSQPWSSKVSYDHEAANGQLKIYHEPMQYRNQPSRFVRILSNGLGTGPDELTQARTKSRRPLHTEEKPPHQSRYRRHGAFSQKTAAEQNRYHKEWFQTDLDPVRLAAQQAAGSPLMDDVKKWYEDDLQLLHRRIEPKLNPEPSGTSWHNAQIEFHISRPDNMEATDW